MTPCDIEAFGSPPPRSQVRTDTPPRCVCKIAGRTTYIWERGHLVRQRRQPHLCVSVTTRSRQARHLLSAHANESGYKLFARTDGATEILLEGLTAGDKLKVRGVNDTNEGPFSPEVTVS
jgi:hypothetical protein